MSGHNKIKEINNVSALNSSLILLGFISNLQHQIYELRHSFLYLIC